MVEENDLAKMIFYFLKNLLLDNIEIKNWQNIIAKINQFLLIIQKTY